MTIFIKAARPFTDSTLPVYVHGTGIEIPGGEIPYRWLAQDLAGAAGTPVASWREKNGAGTLTGGGATIVNVAGYKAVELAGTNSLSIPAGAPLPSSRGSVVGVARLSPAALAATRYGLFAMASSVSPTDGRISKDVDSRVIFDRLGTADVTAKSAGTINPGDFFTFGFSQRAAGAVAMLNGVSFAVGAGDIAGFTRFFVGSSGSGSAWLGSIFEIDVYNAQLLTPDFTAFDAAMREHYSFLS
ncbi:hypothetical protein SRABI98_03554 [Microbacterium sp. Bi98]|uniref:hypothetical protein n=1 Tax=Microbacterium sp. Bi98 TaxID=2821116 RepID=UPI001DA7A7A4|nr:hypothetical protein [Microbacterium sp. Bi98]CAH0262905.1 hypothetical protein SRABI98_03554 [Microbacterium sp. Bi98]